MLQVLFDVQLSAEITEWCLKCSFLRTCHVHPTWLLLSNCMKFCTRQMNWWCVCEIERTCVLMQSRSCHSMVKAKLKLLTAPYQLPRARTQQETSHCLTIPPESKAITFFSSLHFYGYTVTRSHDKPQNVLWSLKSFAYPSNWYGK